jgi:hypothetical protein
VPTVIFKCLFIVSTTKKAVEIKKKYYEAYNVRRKGLNSSQGLKVADYHILYRTSICIRLNSVVFTVEQPFVVLVIYKGIRISRLKITEVKKENSLG